jgi:predicted transcriptional regulator
MKHRVETVSAGESAENALRRMRLKRIHHLVVTLGSEVLGVISARDLDSLGSFRQVQIVEDVMTSPAVTARPGMTLRQAANLLRGRSIGCLPVMEKRRLVGILTITDLLELIGTRGARRSKGEALGDEGPRPAAQKRRRPQGRRSALTRGSDRKAGSSLEQDARNMVLRQSEELWNRRFPPK